MTKEVFQKVITEIRACCYDDEKMHREKVAFTLMNGRRYSCTVYDFLADHDVGERGDCITIPCFEGMTAFGIDAIVSIEY